VTSIGMPADFESNRQKNKAAFPVHCLGLGFGRPLAAKPSAEHGQCAFTVYRSTRQGRLQHRVWEEQLERLLRGYAFARIHTGTGSAGSARRALASHLPAQDPAGNDPWYWMSEACTTTRSSFRMTGRSPQLTQPGSPMGT
jgi:hypothetical protein